MDKKGCTWPGDDALMNRYHDEEWGVPQHDERKLFEFMVLDAFQDGLSWRTVLYKREAFRKAFAGFDVKKVAKFDEAKEQALAADSGIIRNRAKIRGSISIRYVRSIYLAVHRRQNPERETEAIIRYTGYQP